MKTPIALVFGFINKPKVNYVNNCTTLVLRNTSPLKYIEIYCINDNKTKSAADGIRIKACLAQKWKIVRQMHLPLSVISTRTHN